jgi:hypothetical protein
MSEPLNVLDDTQEQTVDAQETDEVAGEAELETEEQTEESGDDGGEPGRQTREENHQVAEFRKKAQAEINRLADEAKQKEQIVSMLFENTVKGEVNPFTGKPIETIEDFIAWKQEDEKQALQKAGLPPDYFEKLINSHPVIQQAAAVIEHNQQIQRKFAVDTEIGKIQAINPKIKSLNDLVMEMKDNEVFEALKNGGMPLSRAYAEVHKIPQRKQDDTKSHLQTLGGGNAGNATDPPQDVVKEYLKWNPKASMDEIRTHWGKNHGGKKK